MCLPKLMWSSIDQEGCGAPTRPWRAGAARRPADRRTPGDIRMRRVTRRDALEFGMLDGPEPFADRVTVLESGSVVEVAGTNGSPVTRANSDAKRSANPARALRPVPIAVPTPPSTMRSSATSSVRLRLPGHRHSSSTRALRFSAD